MLPFSCPSFLSFWLTISILKLQILWVREHFIRFYSEVPVGCQKQQPRSQNFQYILVYSWIFWGDLGLSITTILCSFALPLLLLYLVQNVGSAGVEVAGMVSWVTKVTSLGFLSLSLPKLRTEQQKGCKGHVQRWRGWGGSTRTKPCSVLLIHSPISLGWPYLQSCLSKNGNKKHGKSSQRIPIKYCLCFCVQTLINYLIPKKTNVSSVRPHWRLF